MQNLLTCVGVIGVKVGVMGFEETEQKKRSLANLIKCIVQPQTNRCQLQFSNGEEIVPITPRPSDEMRVENEEEEEGKRDGREVFHHGHQSPSGKWQQHLC